MRNPYLRLSAVPACLAACGALHASELVYEPFDYPASEPLTDLEGGSGWWAAWYGDGDALPASVHSEGLSYTDAIGNQLHVSGLASTTAGAATTRNFRSTEELVLNDVWISFLWNLPETNSLFEGVTFFQGTQTRFAVSNPSTNAQADIVLGVPPSVNVNTGQGELGVTHLIVLRCSSGAGTNGNDLVEIFVDPLLTGIPAAPNRTISIATADFDTIRMAGQNGAPLYIDELRIGTTFASVTPHDAVPDGDSDGDGLSDAQEAILGTDPNVSDAALFAAIQAHPHFFGLYDTESILQQGQGGVVIPKSGSLPVGFSFEIQQSEDLLTWPQVETISRSIELPEGKNFLRVTLEK